MVTRIGPERRRWKRLYLSALTLTSFGTYFTRDISPSGVRIIGPPEIKKKLNLNTTLEFDIRIVHGSLLPRLVSIHCKGEVIRISDPNAYVTEVAIKLHELTTRG